MYTYKNWPVEWIETSCLYLNYSAFRNKIMALYKAKAIKVFNIKQSKLTKILKSAKDINVIVQRNGNYDIALRIVNRKHISWIRVGILLMHFNTNKNNILIINKNMAQLYLSYSIAIMLMLNIDLPRAICLCNYTTCCLDELDVVLNDPWYDLNGLSKPLSRLIVCDNFNISKLSSIESKFSISKFELLNNLTVLVRKLSRLSFLYKPKIGSLSVDDLLILIYIKNLEATIKRSILSFKLDEILQTLFISVSKVERYISDKNL